MTPRRPVPLPRSAFRHPDPGFSGRPRVAFLAALTGVLIAPGLPALVRDGVVNISNRVAWTLAYFLSRPPTRSTHRDGDVEALNAARKARTRGRAGVYVIATVRPGAG